MIKRVLYPNSSATASGATSASVGQQSAAVGGSAGPLPTGSSTALYHLILHTRDKGSSGSGGGHAHVWHAAESLQLAGMLEVRHPACHCNTGGSIASFFAYQGEITLLGRLSAEGQGPPLQMQTQKETSHGAWNAPTTVPSSPSPSVSWVQGSIVRTDTVILDSGRCKNSLQVGDGGQDLAGGRVNGSRVVTERKVG